MAATLMVGADASGRWSTLVITYDPPRRRARQAPRSLKPIGLKAAEVRAFAQLLVAMDDA